jgi:hypothetical protein
MRSESADIATALFAILLHLCGLTVIPFWTVVRTTSRIHRNDRDQYLAMTAPVEPNL